MTSGASDAAISKLAGLLQNSSADVRPPFAAAWAIAAYLRLHLLGSLPDGQEAAAADGPTRRGVVPPPSELVQRDKLACVLRLMEFRTGHAPPMLEATEGVPCRVGLFDGPVALTATLLAFGATSSARAESRAAGLGDALLSLLTSNQDGPLLELSPKGVQAMLEGVQQLVQVDAGGLHLLTGLRSEQPQALAAHGRYAGKVLPELLLLLSERHLEALTTWGDGRQGGGRVEVAQLVAVLVDILMVPLVTSTEVPNQYLEQLVQEGAIQLMVGALEHLDVHEMVRPMALLSRLVTSAVPAFAQQYLQMGGVAPALIQRLLREDNPTPVVVDALTIIGFLAEIHSSSFNTYEPISNAAVSVPQVRRLLTHSDAGVRASVCHLVGNMCRHSFFYSSLERHGVLQALIDGCADSDKETRYFACLAIGHAGFHNATLYEALRPAVAPLVALLKDEVEETRANAAGALGNLARNSGVLCGELIKAGALALLDTAATLEAPPSGWLGSGALGESWSPGKTALFSLGNMCKYLDCRKALLQLGIHQVLRTLSAVPDGTLQKYIQRVQLELKRTNKCKS